jgi:hypothetical protein
MRRSDHINERPERHLEVEVTWIVEDTPERHAAWRRLWRFILDQLDRHDPAKTNAPRGEREASGLCTARQPYGEGLHGRSHPTISSHQGQASSPPHGR